MKNETDVIKIRNPASRPPVGGYGVATKRISVRVPDYVYDTIQGIGHDEFRKFLDRTIMTKDNLRSLTYNYIKKNNIPRVCSKCSAIENIEAHHDDYNNPYVFILLCNKCHNELHKNRGDKKRWSSKLIKENSEIVIIDIDSDVKTELEKIAESEQRTLAGQIRLALSEWLKTKSARPGRGAATKH
jgi:hypothetical protein